MNAIRQIIDVKNHSFNVSLPSDFEADKVEVIIFPAENDVFSVSEQEKKLMTDRLKKTKPEQVKKWKDIKNKYL